MLRCMNTKKDKLTRIREVEKELADKSHRKVYTEKRNGKTYRIIRRRMD